MSPIKVLIADDHKIVRDSLKALINKKGTCAQVIAEADDGRKAIELAQKLRPDVVIMDVLMPDMNGIDATRAIIRDNAGSRIIGLSMLNEKRYILAMLEAGASGYVLKDCSFHELLSAIRNVAGGKLYLCPPASDMIVKGFRDTTNNCSHGPCAVLSPREREILQLYAEGMGTKEIAAHLHISPKTSQSHRRNIEKKLELHGYAELTKYAIREGLVSIER